MPENSPFKNLPITTKFILWFLIIALAPLCIATYISYTSSKRVLQREVADSLLAITANMTNQIENYLDEKKENAAKLSHGPDIVDMIEQFNSAFISGGKDSGAYRKVYAKFAPFLIYYQQSLGYENLFLINPDGEVIFSAKK